VASDRRVVTVRSPRVAPTRQDPAHAPTDAPRVPRATAMRDPMPGAADAAAVADAPDRAATAP